MMYPGPNRSSRFPDMVAVPSGSFLMGSMEGEKEQPIHKVKVSAFHLGRYPVTNAQFAYFLQDYGSDTIQQSPYLGQDILYEYRRGLQKTAKGWQSATGFEQHPAICISWNGAYTYCKWLSAQTNHSYQLPSEAQWEHAARGGPFGKGFPYASSQQSKEVGWYDLNSHFETKPVGLKLANELGLYDMSGNVYEWCADHRHPNYKGAPINGEAWIESGYNDSRVIRGGSWLDYDFICRVSNRDRVIAFIRYYYIGFRVSRY